MSDIFKYLIGATRADYPDSAIAQYTSQYALVHIDSFYFIKVHLQGTAADHAYLDDDPMIGDGKLICPAGKRRSYAERKQGTETDKNDPVISGFKGYSFTFDEVILRSCPLFFLWK